MCREPLLKTPPAGCGRTQKQNGWAHAPPTRRPGLLRVLSYLVQLPGPGGQACILGAQARRSLGGILPLVVLGQKERL